MKRRSARPFTVEIKHTRTSRAALSEATARSREGQSLWQGVALVAAETPPSVPAAPRLQVPSAAPARRILPSLLPVFAPAESPDPQDATARDAPAIERIARVRRPKPPVPKPPVPKPSIRKPSIGKPEPAEVETVPASLGDVKAGDVEPPVQDIAAMSAEGPVPPPSRAGRPPRKPAALAPGERWKRRLPRVLW